MGTLVAFFAGLAVVVGLLGRATSSASAGEPQRTLGDSLERILEAKGPDDLLVACRVLSEAIGERGSEDARFPVAAQRCVEARIQQAAVQSSIADVRISLENVLDSPLVKHDMDRRRLVVSALDEVQRIAGPRAEAPPPAEPRMVLAGVVVHGALSPEQVKRAVLAERSLLQRCYAHVDLDDDRGASKIVVRFIVGRSGSVSSVWSPDGAAACALLILSGLTFPPGQGDASEVTATLVFAPPDDDEPVR